MKHALNNITVLKGDGIGPEVIDQAINVLDAVKRKYGHSWQYTFADIGAVAIDRYGEPFPPHTLEACKSSDAVLLGAIGDPKYDRDPLAAVRPEQGLLAMRKALELHCNIRPVKIFPELVHMSPLKTERLQGVDFVIVRELTGGIYFGKKEKGENYASDLCLYTRHEIERVAKLAFEMALRRKSKLTLVDKANVLVSSQLWREVVQAMSSSYPDVATDFLFVDNAAMQIILNPARFDVVLCSNLFGDIISDEASVLSGSIGMLPSASKGDRYALYEPIHGSYPQAAGKDIANPFAAVLSTAMMLHDAGLAEEADTVERAVAHCLTNQITTPDLGNAFSCSHVGSVLASVIEGGEKKR